MVFVQKSLLDFFDLPCALIVSIDGVQRDPPIHLTKDELEDLLWKNRDEWERISLHFLDGRGIPHPSGPVDLDRADIPNENHFLV